LILGIVAVSLALMATYEPVAGKGSPTVVISQVYGGGGNVGAPYTNDFVEVFNRGESTVSLSDLSLQYASAAGNWSTTATMIVNLSGTLAPGQYYLIQLAAGAASPAALPPPDRIGTIAVSATAGKLALVKTATPLTCGSSATPCSAEILSSVLDLVGFGSTANVYEGTGPTPAPSNTKAVFRAGGGCTDTDVNSADFAALGPSPRNTSSAFTSCTAPIDPAGTGVASPASVAAGDSTTISVTVIPGARPSSTGIAVTANLSAIGGSSAQVLYDDGSNGDTAASDNVFTFATTVASGTTTGAQVLTATITDAEARTATAAIGLTVVAPPTPIHAIQGSTSTSPYAGQAVTTRGVVTARRYNNGFFIQTPDELVDTDPNTSEAVFVYTGGAPPAVAAVGTYVQVSGTAFEYVSTDDPYSPSVTEITSPSVTALSTTYPMPVAVTLTADMLPTTGALDQLEYLEGMRVTVPFLRVVSPTQGSNYETSGYANSTGVFYTVIDGVARPFREAGIQVLDPLPAGAPSTIPRFDFNPERLRVNSYGLIGSTRIEVTTGALLSNTVGVLDYAYRTWTILPDVSAPPTVSGGVTATAVPVPDANEFTVGSFNMQRFFDTANDPDTSDAVLTAAILETRLNKASLAIRTMLLSPDIIGVEEMENLTVLQTVAARINSDTVAAGGTDPGYEAYLEEGNDVGGIDVGFLVKSSRVTVVGVTQYGKDTLFTETDGTTSALNDRPPLLLEALVNGPSGTMPVTVIVNHLRSLSGLTDESTGPRVRAKRLAQAEFLANLIQTRQTENPEERIVSVGDYNAYQVNDGYVDVIGSILGTPTPAEYVTLAGADLVNPDLTDLVNTLSADERYSYTYDGSAQVLDHIIVNSHALQRLTRMHYARMNADFPESYRWVATRPERLSDHDAPVAYFAFPNAPVLQVAGDNPMTVECCTAFVDPGATALDDDYGDLTASIVSSGSVDANTVGTYTRSYSVSNDYITATATRTVNVVDTTPPVLTLNGDSPMTVELGSIFVDPGATATDTCAGSLSSAIVNSGGVDTLHVGTYTVTYTVSDGYNLSSATRTINVVDTTAPTLSTITADPSVLWPPNGRMERVRLFYTVTDVSGPVVCRVGVTSDEPWRRHGHDRVPDWFVVSPRLLMLRAERDPRGDGRIYTITVTCRDASGNRSVGSTTVTVPKDQGHHNGPGGNPGPGGPGNHNGHNGPGR
jgi:predicted extracellular nuclease